MGKIRVWGEWAQVSELVERRTPREPALSEVEAAKPGRHVPVSPDEASGASWSYLASGHCLPSCFQGIVYKLLRTQRACLWSILSGWAMFFVFIVEISDLMKTGAGGAESGSFGGGRGCAWDGSGAHRIGL